MYDSSIKTRPHTFGLLQKGKGLQKKQLKSRCIKQTNFRTSIIQSLLFQLRRRRRRKYVIHNTKITPRNPRRTPIPQTYIYPADINGGSSIPKQWYDAFVLDEQLTQDSQVSLYSRDTLIIACIQLYASLHRVISPVNIESSSIGMTCEGES